MYWGRVSSEIDMVEKKWNLFWLSLQAFGFVGTEIKSNDLNNLFQ